MSAPTKENLRNIHDILHQVIIKDTSNGKPKTDFIQAIMALQTSVKGIGSPSVRTDMAKRVFEPKMKAILLAFKEEIQDCLEKYEAVQMIFSKYEIDMEEEGLDSHFLLDFIEHLEDPISRLSGHGELVNELLFKFKSIFDEQTMNTYKQRFNIEIITGHVLEAYRIFYNSLLSISATFDPKDIRLHLEQALGAFTQLGGKRKSTKKK